MFIPLSFLDYTMRPPFCNRFRTNHFFPCIGCSEVTLMNPCELTASITAIANTLTCGLTAEEANLLGTIFTQLGDTILTIAAHKSLCQSK